MNMQAITPDRDEARFLDVVLPEQVNNYGILHGANALQVMGKAAFVCATRHARCAVIMAKADNIEFTRPIRTGAIIDIRANVIFQGHSSMTIIVEIIAEDPAEQASAPSISGCFMMVAVNADGVPMPIYPHKDQPPAEDVIS